MATSDVTFAQDGGGNVKLHPYVVALVRWCMSCVWSAATVLLHRLMTAPLPPIAAPKLIPSPPSRPASSGHLHPEPLVECVVLHQPDSPADVDFVFVHGLYGSLENTWRQGEWRSKYKIEPNRTPLKRSSSIPTPCICEDCTSKNRLCIRNINKTSVNNVNMKPADFIDESYIKENLNLPLQKVLPNEDLFITEKFYNNTLLNQVKIVDNFEMQAQFVRDLFNNENMCDTRKLIYDDDEDSLNLKDRNLLESDIKKDSNAAKCTKIDEFACECKECNDKNGKRCAVGCGCNCDDCYSPCWPRDWLRVDFPGARIISVNYTSDPYLWRPLWVKENKRLRLHERAEQMTQQLLDLGVGERPIVWVGHSKGGLFIKQIYCEAYEAHLKATTKQKNSNGNGLQIYEGTIRNDDQNDSSMGTESQNDFAELRTTLTHIENEITGDHETESLMDDIFRQAEFSERYGPKSRAGLWSKSAGFMFYSVPHRGSPLADIKTPITARSIELLEISKDNSLVLSLQERWLRATEPSQPVVRSLVETNRTLMSVLWLRIVSAESADAGIGALCGISLDHREICKPSSRSCILYKELTNLIQASIDRWRCSS